MNIWIYSVLGEAKLTTTEEAEELLDSEDWADTPAAFLPEDPVAAVELTPEEEQKAELRALLSDADVKYDKRASVKKLNEIALENGLSIE